MQSRRWSSLGRHGRGGCGAPNTEQGRQGTTFSPTKAPRHEDAEQSKQDLMRPNSTSGVCEQFGSRTRQEHLNKPEEFKGLRPTTLFETSCKMFSRVMLRHCDIGVPRSDGPDPTQIGFRKSSRLLEHSGSAAEHRLVAGVLVQPTCFQVGHRGLPSLCQNQVGTAKARLPNRAQLGPTMCGSSPRRHNTWH